MLNDRNKVWVRVMNENYLKHSDFLSTSVPSNASWSWKSIIKGRTVVGNNIGWRLGDGNAINLWADHWAGTKPPCEEQCVNIPEGLEDI